MSNIVQFEIPLASNINTDTVPLDIKPLGGVAPHVENTGILNDGGVTNLRETTIDDSASYDKVFWTSSGKQIGVKKATSSIGVFIDGEKNLTINGPFVNQRGLITDYDDALPTADGKILAIKKINATTLNYYELDYDLNVLNQKAHTPASTFTDQERIIKDVNITYANVKGVYNLAIKGCNVKFLGGTTRAMADSESEYISCWVIPGTNNVLAGPGASDRPYLSTAGGAFAATLAEKNSPFLWGSPNLQYIVISRSRDDVGVSNGPQVLQTYSSSGLQTLYTSPSANDVVVATGYGFQAIKSGVDSSTGKILRAIKGDIAYSNVDLTTTSAPGVRPSVLVGANIETEGNWYYSTISGSVGAICFVGSSDTSNGYIRPVFQVGGISQIEPHCMVKFTVPTGSEKAIVWRDDEGGLNYLTYARDIATFDIQMQEINDRYIRFNSLAYNSIVDTELKITVIDSILDLGDGFYNSSSITSARLLRTAVSESYSSPVFINQQVRFPPYYKDYAYYQNGFFSRGDPNLNGTAYIAPVNLPPAVGSVFEGGAITLNGKTAIQTPNFCGYRAENQLETSYRVFSLYGQLYGFDGTNIDQIPFNGAIISQPSNVAKASGLRYLATSPSSAFFVSDYDNSLWTFDGGRTVNKLVKMNRKARIVDAKWSTRDNELAIRTEDSIIFLRDGILTETDLPFVGDFVMHPTSDGVYYVQGAVSKRFDYNTGTVKPLVWQSAYYGLEKNQTMLVNEYDIAVSSITGDLTTLTATVETVTATERKTQSKSWTITPEMWTSDKYIRLRIQPEQRYVLGSSLRLQTDQHIVILSVDLIYQPYNQAVIPAGRSI